MISSRPIAYWLWHVTFSVRRCPYQSHCPRHVSFCTLSFSLPPFVSFRRILPCAITSEIIWFLSLPVLHCRIVIQLPWCNILFEVFICCSWEASYLNALSSHLSLRGINKNKMARSNVCSVSSHRSRVRQICWFWFTLVGVILSQFDECLTEVFPRIARGLPEVFGQSLPKVWSKFGSSLTKVLILM